MIYTETAVTRHLEAFCREHLARHDSPAYQEYVHLREELLRQKAGEQLERHDNGGLFGMSQAGGCQRAAALKRAGAPTAPFSGSELMTFEIGHLLEVSALALLGAAGYSGDFEQVPASFGPFFSAADGLLRSGPVPLPYPLGLSVKTSSYKMSSRRGGTFTRRGFCALPLDGVKSQSSWYAQAQLEMEALGFEAVLFLVVAKDMVKAMEDDPIMKESGSMTFYAEVVRRDRSVAQALAALYEQAKDAAPMSVPPRVFRALPRPELVELPVPGDAGGWGGDNQLATGTFNPCFGCGYNAVCRGAAKEVKP